MVGRTISHYRILDKIGEGGMGVVYKAEDTRLDRLVALKFLSSHMLDNQEARERFVHEAKAAATLEHPNICTVHEIDEIEGEVFLAMAYVDGPTLKRKIDERPLKLRQALDFAIQIGQGLQAAHDRGIVHRDIKPANLMLAADGHVKIMDFGLAHLGGRTKITKTGMVLGTPSYMAPEQLRGEETDRRADIWSFGVVLHEMVAGRPPFEGETEETLSYAILHTEPEPLTALRSGLPVELDRIAGKALAKDAADRYQHVDDILVDLRALQKRLPETTRATGAAAVEKPLPSPPRGGRLRYALGAFLIGAAVASLVFSVFQFRPARSEPPLRKLTLVPREPLQISTYNTDTVLSPDGRNLAYRAGGGLWVQDLRSDEPRKIEAAGGSNEPFWSPDGSSIGYFQRGQLKTVPVDGGSPGTLCSVSGEPWGGSWSPDGQVIVFTAGTPPKLFEVSASGGEARLAVAPAASGAAPGEPTGGIYTARFLPAGAGRRVVIFVSGTQSEPVMMVQDLETGRRETLGPGALPWYSPSGHIVYQETGLSYSLWAMPFSLDRLKATGPAFRVALHGRDPTVASDGTLAYVLADLPEQQLSWFNRQGMRLGTLGEPQRELANPELSPDDRLLAVVAGEDWNHRDLWVYDTGRGARTRVTDARKDLYNVFAPAWSPGGHEVTFNASGQGIFARRVNSAEAGRKLFSLVTRVRGLDWSADGQYLVYCIREGNTGEDIWYLKREGEGGAWVAHAFSGESFGESDPRLSPGGRFVAYASDESGRREIYVRSFPDGGRRWLVSVNGGAAPRWSRDGRELYYVEGGETLVAVPVSLTPDFTAGAPVRLFRHPALAAPSNFFVSTYAISKDGQRFLLAEPVREPSPPLIRIVQNWYAEFRDRR